MFEVLRNCILLIKIEPQMQFKTKNNWLKPSNWVWSGCKRFWGSRKHNKETEARKGPGFSRKEAVKRRTKGSLKAIRRKRANCVWIARAADWSWARKQEHGTWEHIGKAGEGDKVEGGEAAETKSEGSGRVTRINRIESERKGKNNWATDWAALESLAKQNYMWW